MRITLNSAGKKFLREWVFRNANISFSPGQKTAILGPNGSGKSTLLQAIAGSIFLNEGTITYHNESIPVSSDEIYSKVSFASPYLELIEEFTLMEIIRFHFSLKPAIDGLTDKQAIDISGLSHKSDQVFKYFSSGMKQRIKLSLAFLSDAPIMILDEPCSNLDSMGVSWYKEMIEKYSRERIVIIASNQNEDEFDFCERSIEMNSLKGIKD